MFSNAIIIPFLALSAVLAVDAQTSSSSASSISGGGASSETPTPTVSSTTVATANGTATGTTANGTATGTAALPTISGVNIADIPPCILNCITSSVSFSNCENVEDITCVCSSQSFLLMTISCVATSCTTEDVNTARGLEGTLCGINTAANSTSTPASGNSSATASSTTPNSSSTPNTAAVVMPFKLSTAHAIGAVGVALAMITGVGSML